MKLYIVGPVNRGEGVYSLIAETGEFLASHMCTNASYAKSDLESGRPERQKEFLQKFGPYEVLFIGDDKFTTEELLEKNKEWYSKVLRSGSQRKS